MKDKVFIFQFFITLFFVFPLMGLARISHQISEQIAPLLPQIASQNGEGSVHETRTHRAGEQDGVTRCASCQRAGEKCGLEEFTSFQNREDVQKAVNFLTSTSDENGAGYIGTAGVLNNLYLPLSYFSTPAYWGEYICDQLGNDCRVVDVFNPDDFTLSPSEHSPGRALQYERINVFNGTDIYDASTWQIALALAARDNLMSSRREESLIDMVENQNLLLLYGHDGNHRSDPVPFGTNRATTKNDGTFTYNGQEIIEPENAYFYRMVSKEWLATDPFVGTKYAYNITVENLPDDNLDYQKGKVSWADWKPITGENAWAFLIGPL